MRDKHNRFGFIRRVRHFGVSQREVLENIIEAATKSATAKMTEDERDHFYRELVFQPRARKDELLDD